MSKRDFRMVSPTGEADYPTLEAMERAGRRRFLGHLGALIGAGALLGACFRFVSELRHSRNNLYHALTNFDANPQGR